MGWSWGIIIFIVLHIFMMMFMMKGHNHGGKSNHNHKKHVHNQPTELNSRLNQDDNRSENYRIKQLEGELAFLKNQNELLQKKIDTLS